MLRRPHRKSRGGCNECKQRRYKCDEAKPACSRCSTRQLSCVYDAVQPRAAPRHSTTSSTSTAVEHSPPPPPSEPASELDLTVLKLFHHFIRHTAKTCDNSGKTSKWWEESVPALAVEHDYLTYAIVSFAALHLATESLDKQRWITLARGYRDRSVSIMSNLLLTMSRDESSACFWSSALIGLITLGMNTIDDETRVSPSTLLLNLSVLWKGAHTVKSAPATTPTEALIVMPQTPTGNDTEFDNILDQLSTAILDDTPPENHASYNAAIKHLRQAFALSAVDNDGGGVLSWIACLSHSVLDEMRNTKPAACLLFIFYGAALHRLKGLWYVGEMGALLVAELTPTVSTKDKTLVALVNWAREKVCS